MAVKNCRPNGPVVINNMVRFTVRAQSLMKRLVPALAAVCVGMPAYGSDIVVLADLEEKYIVKKSAVRVTLISNPSHNRRR